MEATCATLLRSFGWAQTPLGPYEAWPSRLRGFAAMVIEHPSPAILYWGRDLVQIYNDAYASLVVGHHPRGFGARHRENGPELFRDSDVWLQRVLAGEGMHLERARFHVVRQGYSEEAYFTIALSPLRDDQGAVAGALQIVSEVTHAVIEERRADTLRRLAEAAARGVDVARVFEVLGEELDDLPFALYFAPDARGALVVQASHGAVSAVTRADEVVATAWRDQRALRCDASALLGGQMRAEGEEPPVVTQAYVSPVPRRTGGAPYGVLAVGLSPRLSFDDRYRAFVEQIAARLASCLDALVAQRAEHDLVERLEIARAQAELERRRLRSVFMQAPVAITVLLGAQYVIELANPAVLRIWGVTADDVHGRPMFDAMPELAGQGLEALLDDVWRTGRSYVGTEVPTRLRQPQDGAPVDRYFNFVHEPLIDARRQVTGIVSVATDVTNLVRARHAAESLARALDSSRKDAEEARDASLRANRAKDEFLAMLGHELRNPLAPIFTALDLIRLRSPGAPCDREFAVIERQARHLAGLVDDLLDVSRITSGKIELHRADIDLATVIGKAIETVSPVLEKQRHELTTDLEPGLTVHGDGTRLTQVFANLLVNAVKYTDSGGKIMVEARRDKREAVVAVRDTGRGITQEMLARVFDLFVQEPQNLDRALGGLGVGLSIVKSLVEMHGGRVEALSEGTGRGSTFMVHLPLSSGTATRAVRPESPYVMSAASVAAEGRTLLVVDDNEDAAFLLADALGRLGYRCAVAHDGPGALSLAKASAFDAVLLDIGLPGMDGYEVAAKLRQLPGWDQVTLIALTGYGARGDRDRSARAGFDHHLVKPVDMAALAGLLASALR